MLKKLIMLVASLTLSISASAGYTQYTFNDARFNDGAVLEGFFVQNDADRSIAYYNFGVQGMTLGEHFAPSGYYDNILRASISMYAPGPTNFTVYDDLSDAYYAEMNLIFRPTAIANTFRVGGSYRQTALYTGPEYDIASGYLRLISGTVVRGPVDNPVLLANLETGDPFDGIHHIVPTPLPEPGSLALMMLAAGALAVSRRAKSTA